MRFVATAKSAIKVSSVSPDLCEIIVFIIIFLAKLITLMFQLKCQFDLL